MPTSYIWDSGQEMTGVQGVVAGGVQFDLLTGAVGGGGASLFGPNRPLNMPPHRP